MGRIKSLMIKRASRQLITGNHKFSESFDTNKRILSNNMPSKSVRNKIAGYIARMIRMQKNLESKPKEKKIISDISEEY